VTKIPSYPAPPGTPKQSGGGGPHPVVGSIDLKDPGGPGGGGGGSAGRRELKWKKKEKESELDADTLKVGEVETALPTMQAALSQRNGNGKVVNPSALRKFLNGHGLRVIGNTQADELEPACPFTGIEIPDHLLPATEAEEIHLRELITDPRAGFAPEGLDAFDLELAEHVVLTRIITGPGDFSEGGGAQYWSVVVLSEEETAVEHLTRATKAAGSTKQNLLLSTPSNPAAQLIDAILNVGKVLPKCRIHVAMR
jgi:hypothetical protein